MTKLVVPTINNNDTFARLKDWSVEHGSAVSKGDVVAVLETSKASYDLEAEEDGLIYHSAKLEDKCSFGSHIGFIFSSKEEFDNFSPEELSTSDSSELTLTASAKKYLQENNIDKILLGTIGKSIIRKSDLERFTNGSSKKEKVVDNELQTAIAVSVSKSKKEIPHAFVTLKINCNNLLSAIDTFNKKHSKICGLPEFLIKTISVLQEKHPYFFGESSEGRFVPNKQSNIGVTLDLGEGLFVPVIKDVVNLGILEVADTLMKLRVRAMRKCFSEADFSDGAISISLNMDEDVTLVQPIILYPQIAMLSLTAIQNELTLDEKQNVKEVNFVNLGLSYDHRFINGQKAIQFLKDIKSVCEVDFLEILSGS